VLKENGDSKKQRRGEQNLEKLGEGGEAGDKSLDVLGNAFKREKEFENQVSMRIPPVALDRKRKIRFSPAS